MALLTEKVRGSVVDVIDQRLTRQARAESREAVTLQSGSRHGPSHAPARPKAMRVVDVVGTASAVPDDVLVAAVDEVRTTTGPALASSGAVVKSIAPIVPDLEESVGGLTAQVAAIVGVLPIVGDGTAVTLPPIDMVPGVIVPRLYPLPPLAPVTESGVAQDDSDATPPGPDAAYRWRCGLTSTPGDAPTDELTAQPAVRWPPSEAGRPDAPTGPGPWGPHDSSPLPTQPSTTSTTGGSAGDSAARGPSLVLPSTTMSGAPSADWRIPRALPAHPDTQPD